MQLTEKYKPEKIADFCGLDSVKRKLTRFAAHPQEDAFYFYGPSGTGKTTMALALARQIGAQVIHIPSQRCNVQALEELRAECSYLPMYGAWRLVLVDEADAMSEAAKLGFLSILDSTERPAQTIFVFTSNEEHLKESEFEIRFLSRTKPIKFSTYGINGDASALLRCIWEAECANGLCPTCGKSCELSRIADPYCSVCDKCFEPQIPDFKRLLNDNGQNIRAALNSIELRLMGGE